MKRLLSITLALMCAWTWADQSKEVHVYQQTSAGGVTTQLSDQTLMTGSQYSTVTAPKLAGYIFTHWSISRTQTFVNRDRLGRALDLVTFGLYEETTLTANYLPESQDADNDGVADGWEIYWYGSLAESASSDSDRDGLTFAQELAAGTNPLMPNESQEGGIVWDEGGILQYNPTGLQSYTIRSEPEGQLFATITDFVEPGTSVTTPTCNRLTSNFAYWTRDGVRVQDRRGRAVDGITFSMPTQAVEFVAVCISDANLREQHYWYGTEVGMSSDTDGDGMTLAQEIAAGTNPLMPNESLEGGIVWDQGDLLQYNPEAYRSYTIRSEPEGELFATQTDIVKIGTSLTSPLCSHSNSKFAYWTLNGVRQQDRHGRALDQVAFVMPSNEVELVAVCIDDEAEREQLYWYGANPGMDSDTDGDGMTLAQEVAAGTNPLIANESLEGGIIWDQGELVETDLQVYEQARGALVDNGYAEIFTSPIAGNEATSRTFGQDLNPIVWDVNGDGLFDIVLIYRGGYTILVNVGSRGNPEFEESATATTNGVDLAANSLSKLDGLEFDTPLIAGLSCTFGDVDQDGVNDILASDSEGRIWFYNCTGEGSYTLRHKVWGGTRSGFAVGLMISAVDWDDDGDLDCLAGTADGKLMLLRDPKVGRPTNLKAFAGVDNILLTWDPNQQSRIRGYRVYRSLPEQDGASPSSTRIAQPPLPTYRDFPPTTDEYAYKVSSVSRFYTAGNSTPTETESPTTEAVSAKTGSVKFFWNDAVAKVGEQVAVMLSIENSMNYTVADKSQTVVYDPAYLTPVKVVKTGLTEGFEVVDLVGRADPSAPSGGASPSGAWQITIESGALGDRALPAGGGKFLVLVFEAKKEGTTKVGGDTGATVSIAAASSPVVPYQLGDVDGDGDVDVEDLRLLAKLKNGNGRKHTANQLKAGDFNRNGKLDNADYQALREVLKEMEVL